MKERQIKKILPGILRQDDFSLALEEIRGWPSKFTISPLLSCIYQLDEVIKWRAILALAMVMNNLANENLEEARSLSDLNIIPTNKIGQN